MDAPPSQPPKLIEQVRNTLRQRNYAYATEKTYLDWIKRYIIFHKAKLGFARHPKDMGAPEIEAFLTYLALEKNVAPATQDQALTALIFLYKHVLKQELGPINAIRPKKPKRLPTVLNKEETQKIIGLMSGTHQLMAKLLYGSGLRLMECLRLRVKDIDLTQRMITVRDGKGEKDRVTMLPERVVEPLRVHLEKVKHLHLVYLEKGYGSVELPYALERKYPNAHEEWGWQYVFPAM